VHANALVRPVLRASEHDAELVAEELEALRARVEAVRLEAAEQQLDTVRDECVVKVLLQDAEEDLLVGRARESLEDHDDRDHVFGFAPAEPQSRTTVREVVQSVGLRRLVRPYGSDLDTVRRVGGASILERVSDDRGDVIPPRHDQETDQPLVSVDDEVATHLFGLFMVRDELRRRQVAEVTPSGL
jgi:hypothetical protein